MEERFGPIDKEEGDNLGDIDQMDDDDMPGEDEPEWMDEDDPEYDPDEYGDDFDDDDEPEDEDYYDDPEDEPGDEDEADEDEPSEDEPEEEDEEPEEEDEDEKEDEPEKSWLDKLKDKFAPLIEGKKDDDTKDEDPNGDKDDEDEPEDEQDEDDDGDEDEKEDEPEKSLWDKVLDKMKAVGQTEADDAKKVGGWLSDAVSNAKDKLSAAAKNVSDWFGDKVAKVNESTGGLVDSAKNAVQNATEKAKNAASSVASALASPVKKIFSWFGGDDGKGMSSRDLYGNGEPDVANVQTIEATGLAADLSVKVREEEASPDSMTSKMLQQMNDEAPILEKARLREDLAKKSLEGDKQAAMLLDTQPYQLLQDALVEDFQPQMTAFGVVANGNVGNMGTERKNIVFSAGVLNTGLSSAFLFVGDQLNGAGKIIGGASVKIDGTEEVSETLSDGVAKQFSYASTIISDTKELNNQLNQALLDIHQKIGTVGKIATSVLKTGYDVGEFGKLVRRMSVARNGRPTPVEEFVGMVTKRDTTGATMM